VLNRTLIILTALALIAPAAVCSGAGAEDRSADQSEDQGPAMEHVDVEVALDRSTLAPSGQGTLGVRFRIADEWHLYWRNNGDSGMPIAVTFEAPDGVRIGEPRWPAPIRYVYGAGSVDYTYANERLARHYGIDGVVGEEFRLVRQVNANRRGILGHGSVLTLTSHAGRTSPVLRGKWVMEVVMGTPPPPPPPGVPPLDETAAAVSEGRVLTTKDRMEIHRQNPTCNACHRFIDPIGLALDNYDVTGQWRIKEGGTPLDTNGELYDGTPVTSPLSLQQALLDRSVLLVRSFTGNLMAYALGRRMEYYDQPTIRSIVDRAADQDYRMSAFVKGVVQSDAFQMQKAGTATEVASSAGHE